MFAQTDTRDEPDALVRRHAVAEERADRRFWNNSPLKDVAKVKTPTLFFVGENDARVPMAQSIEMYRALKANGVPTHLYVAPREGHQWGELRHQLFKANVELEWFEHTCMDRAVRPRRRRRPPGRARQPSYSQYADSLHYEETFHKMR